MLPLIDLKAGAAAMYQAITGFGVAVESDYKGPIKLEGDPKSASMFILGADLAGMTTTLELRQAEYKIRIFEYNTRSSGRR